MKVPGRTEHKADAIPVHALVPTGGHTGVAPAWGEDTHLLEIPVATALQRKSNSRLQHTSRLASLKWGQSHLRASSQEKAPHHSAWRVSPGAVCAHPTGLAQWPPCPASPFEAKQCPP